LLVADETLTIGRTGKFFAYNHYKAFSPDFIIFGKGNEIAGIASCDKWTKDFNLATWRQTTLQADAVALLKSCQILNCIKQRNKIDEMLQYAATTITTEDCCGICKQEEGELLLCDGCNIGLLTY
jgi:acetylornithine/succinyldiaminopimelate/putrescine aminotransferase